MRHIGKGGEVIEKHSYYTWPLFRDLRMHQKFLEAYREIFGHDYVTDLRLETAKSKQQLTKPAEIPKTEGDVVISDNIAGVEDFAQEKSGRSEPQLSRPAEES